MGSAWHSSKPCRNVKGEKWTHTTLCSPRIGTTLAGANKCGRCATTRVRSPLTATAERVAAVAETLPVRAVGLDAHQVRVVRVACQLSQRLQLRLRGRKVGDHLQIASEWIAPDAIEEGGTGGKVDLDVSEAVPHGGAKRVRLADTRCWSKVAAL